MKRSTLKFIVFVAVFALPAMVYAQASGLVPCGNVPTGSADYFNPAYYLQATSCNICYFIQLIQNVVNFLIMITIPISVAMFAWAGINFFTAAGNPKRIQQAKRIFTSVFWGFIIAISGWLVVQVVLQNIAKADFYSANSWVTVSASCNQFNGNGGIGSPRPRNVNIATLLGTNSLAVSQTPLNGEPWSGGGTGPTSGGGTDLNAVQRAVSAQGIMQACQNNSSVDCTLLQAVCVVESGCGQAGAGCNSYGACGPMQIKPATACGVDSSIAGCATNNMTAVANELQNMSTAASVAAKILQSANGSCNGDLTCVMAYYNGGPGAVAPSACCASGLAYQCQWDCGTTAPHAFQCDATGARSSACVQNKGYQETRNYVPKIQAAQATIQVINATP